MQIEEWLEKQLEKRRTINSFRSLGSKINQIDFASNDYLGLSRNKELHQLINEKQAQNTQNGSTGSRLLSGNNSFYEEVESNLAQLFNAANTLVFNSGYSANLAILSSVPTKNDTIIYDEYAHASIKDGARLSFAKKLSFKHNDVNDLEHKIKKSTGQIFIVAEAIYSMDGDECPIEEFVNIAQKYNANIILDEAHSTGLYGKTGGGLSQKLNCETKIFARIYTFGKGMGIHGAAIAGNRKLIEYLINFARPFIYTTSLPPHSIIAISEAFKYLNNNMHLQVISQQKVALFNKLFDEKLSTKFNKILSDHPIQSIVIEGNDAVKKISQSLIDFGYDLKPILAPTVKQGQERIRICLHTYNSDKEISKLIDTLAIV